MKKVFFELAFIAKTCICCRMSPSQKSEIVKLCKSQGTWTTLAIGDGANDVSMIQEAHVGIGVAGKEGTQALLAAEYTISQFSHLTRMLLVHGRYSYIRMSRFINYYFYKNFMMAFCEAWLAFYCGYSGQLYYLDWIPPFYNFFWTSWPSLAFFSLEQDVSPSECMKYPNLYTAGQKNAFFSTKIFWGWNLLAFFSATFIFWFSASSLDGGVGADGHEPTLFWISTTSFLILMHTVNLKLIITSKFWNKINL
jgi:magnesium-transporting ATPase (P-type)